MEELGKKKVNDSDFGSIKELISNVNIFIRYLFDTRGSLILICTKATYQSHTRHLCQI